MTFLPWQHLYIATYTEQLWHGNLNFAKLVSQPKVLKLQVMKHDRIKVTECICLCAGLKIEFALILIPIDGFQ